jgi:tRNA dimethylallyltransferase
MPRELVYEKINNNVEKMIKNGWKEEIEKLYKKDKNVGKLNAFKAIGYPIILDAIENKKEIDVDLIKQKTRQYAKRQMTWIKYHYKDHFIFSQDSIQTLFKKIKSFL